MIFRNHNNILIYCSWNISEYVENSCDASYFIFVETAVMHYHSNKKKQTYTFIQRRIKLIKNDGKDI